MQPAPTSGAEVVLEWTRQDGGRSRCSFAITFVAGNQQIRSPLRVEREISTGSQGPLVQPLVSLHVSNCGEGHNFWLEQPLNAAVDEPFAQLHQSTLANKQVLLCCAEGLDGPYLLAAAWEEECRVPLFYRGKRIFMAYAVATEIFEFNSRLLNTGTLHLVFDLDDTVWSAMSMSDLQRLMRKLNAALATLLERMSPAEVAQAAGGRIVGEIKSKDVRLVLQLKASLATAEQHIAMMESFNEGKAVQRDGQCFPIKMEEAKDMAGDSCTRPVVRMPAHRQFLIRIDPDNTATSMLVTLREGLPELARHITGVDREKPQGPRWKATICTGAELKFAHEAVRVLDCECFTGTPDKVFDSGVGGQPLIISVRNSATGVATDKELLAALNLPASCAHLPLYMGLVMIVDDRCEEVRGSPGRCPTSSGCCRWPCT
jgi:hypothetical protein